ncbi:hypothetical protein ACFOY4_41525 [Actinomadura syzygii]|uniref:Uncharacterized protein n=1 Tax=Actinomadura syzygii TaxID=1427538 RepID=A0A5D0TRR3_9ACTN|nr:hypothetical protein [Actinomadura syzygii]TYC07599.1 hypothetical protein FXF65_42120 [Actinomadura syzygii]
MRFDLVLLLAGVLVVLAFFALVAFIVHRLGATSRAAAVIMAVDVLVAALPPVLSVLQGS